MKRDMSVQKLFLERFIAVAEKQVGMGRYEWGFLTEVTKSLKLKKVSVVQRWFDGFSPGIPHLLTIYNRWGVTPNELLGLESTQKRKAAPEKRN